MNCACAEWTNQVADSQIWTNQEPCVITRNGTDQPTNRQTKLIIEMLELTAHSI